MDADRCTSLGRSLRARLSYDPRLAVLSPESDVERGLVAIVVEPQAHWREAAVSVVLLAVCMRQMSLIFDSHCAGDQGQARTWVLKSLINKAVKIAAIRGGRKTQGHDG